MGTDKKSEGRVTRIPVVSGEKLGTRKARLSEQSLLSVLLDDIEHRLGVRGLFERLAEIGFVEELGNVGERVKMLLKLTLRHEEQHDELDRLVVERIEVDPFLGTAQRADDFVNQVRRSVRDTDAEADAGTHGRLAFLYRGG